MEKGKFTVNNNSHDNRSFAPEGPDSTSTTDCQLSESCINRKLLSKGEASGDNS